MVSLWVVLIAAIIGVIIGAVWYSKSLFGKTWLRLSGMREIGGGMGIKSSYLVVFISTLVLAYVLGYIISAVGVTTVGGGIGIAFLLWLGFVVTISLSSVLWEKKPFSLYLIEVAQYLVSLLVMGAIMGAWV